MAEQQLLVDCGPMMLTTRAMRLRKLSGERLPAPHAPKDGSWPPDYESVLAWRFNQLARFEHDPNMIPSAKQFYRDHPVEFINHWCSTYDPRNAVARESVWLPLILFDKQVELVEFVSACLHAQESGLVEKSRDMGATWCCIAFTTWLFLFWDQVAVGWGSRKREQVDRIGDQSSLFEKMRMLLRALPDAFKPKGFDENEHLTYMRCLNPETGSSVIGEIGDDIGRGGRTLIYFVDEAGHLEHPERVEAALLANSNVRIDISSVSGLGTVFYRKREAGVDWRRGQEIAKGKTNVFVMDWQDHPRKTQEWHDTQKAKLEGQGLGHVFAREVERNYASAVEGVIIPADWVVAAIDSNKKLQLDNMDAGKVIGGLDVADSGRDNNALVVRKGAVVKLAEEWGERDTGRTARRAVGALTPHTPCELQYDAIGVGAGIKAETNRLCDDNLLPKGLTLMPWVAGAAVQDPYGHVIPGDKHSPLNRDFYANLKAQAWWNVRRLFETTYRAVTEQDYNYDVDDLICLPSDLPLLRKLQKELSQAVATRTTSLKLVVDKTPEGAMSPNLADSLVMAFFPARLTRMTPTVSLAAPIIIRAEQ